MRSIAIITARGGSQRIPKKNIKLFCGKPIISYSIKAALDSELFDEVMVSTDSEEIASVAKDCGAKVPFMRSEATSDDYATTADVLNEVLAEYQKRGLDFDWMCCIYPTAPFVTGEKLVKAWEYLNKNSADALTPVVKFSYPPQRCFVLDGSYLRYKWPEYMRSRS
ncbi:MAG: pseudaminic acid cytidylyltransferase, partial [Selenomonadaceae bacterium]|nr:pseudaminic acid cytidylyltransferase [Selenomonadaceae bacterium]